MLNALYGKASCRVAVRYLQAAPLDGYHSMKSKEHPKTVGWRLEGKKADLERVTSYFKSRKDSWAIVIKPDAVSFDDVEYYVGRTPKLKRSKIIVVESDSLEGDDTHPDFVVIHDIIGHSIETYSNGEGLGDVDNIIGQMIHLHLPSEYKIQDQDSDKVPDILAAIFFHAASHKDLINKTVGGLEKTYEKGMLSKAAFDVFREMIESGIEQAALNVARWSSKFMPGVPRLVKLW